MKKILHIIAQVPGQTGSGTFLQSLVRESHKKGYAQGLVAGVPRDYQREEFLDLYDVDFYPVYFETDEITFPVVGMSDEMPYRSTKYRELTENMLTQWKAGFTAKVSEAIETFKPDVIISHHLWLLTAIASRIAKNIPVGVICHGTDLRQLSQVERFAEDVISGCRGVDVVFALSDHHKGRIVEDYGIEEEKIKVVGGGYRSDLFYCKNNKNTSDRIKLVYVGKLSNSKGVASLIRAFNKIRYENAELWLVGSGTGEEAEKIKELGTSSGKTVKFTGALPHERVSELLRDSDIFVLASFYEGLSLALIEGLASGLRIVTSDLPGLRAWLGRQICDCGAVEFVKLPKMIGVDKPLESELPEYEDRIKAAIEKQIERILTGEVLDHRSIDKDIARASWESVFTAIEGGFK